MSQIGHLYQSGLGVPQDYEQAMSWYQKAAEKGSRGGMVNMGELYAGSGRDARLRSGDDLVSQGGPVGRSDRHGTRGRALSKRVGVVRGTGDQRDDLVSRSRRRGQYRCDGECRHLVSKWSWCRSRIHPQALVWYRKAADKENPFAMYDIGDLYFKGFGVGQDYAGNELVPQGSGVGSGAAMNQIGWIYGNALGVAQDYGQAMSWFQKAADLKNADGMRNIGVIYEHAFGVAQDYQRAMSWYRKAADAGDTEAMNDIGGLYATGSGVERDDWKALDWFQRSADRGNGNAMAFMGVFYDEGRAVAKDEQKARQWYLKAANAGNDDAKKWLGAAWLIEGRGVDCTSGIQFACAEYQRKKGRDQTTSFLLKWIRRIHSFMLAVGLVYFGDVTHALARAGGGEGYSGGGGGGGGSGGGGGGGIGWLIYFWIRFCIEYPYIGLPVTLVVVFFLYHSHQTGLSAISRQRHSPRRGCG